MLSRTLVRRAITPQAAISTVRCAPLRTAPIAGLTSLSGVQSTKIVRAPLFRTATSLIHTQDSKRSGAAPSSGGPTCSKSGSTAATPDILSRSVACAEAWACKLKTASTAELMHVSSQSLVVLAPAAWLLSPSCLNFPVDVALGIVLPLHAHIGWQSVAIDYVPKEFSKIGAGALYLLTFITVVGLLKVNLCGPGITESVKSIWRRPRAAQDVAAEKAESAAVKAAAKH